MKTATQEPSIEELEALLAKKKKAQKAKAEKEKKQYETKRDDTVSELMQEALQLRDALETFKAKCHASLEEHAVLLNDYGLMRSNSKGGFSLTDSTGTLRITRRRDTEPHFDERALKAVELLKEFLGDAVKKRDAKLYDILISFLERNKQGDMEYGRVMMLWQHEDKFEDKRWLEGLRLIKESYTTHSKGFGYEFKTRAAEKTWQNINLTFASV